MRFGRYDAIVLLHSVFSNQNEAGRHVRFLRANGSPKVWFIGNEYKLMPEKMAFGDAIGVRLLVSQCDSERVHAMYRERLGCEIGWLPNTGLDTGVFCPGPPLADRPIDVGYRAYASPLYLGNDEREQLAATFSKECSRAGLVTDISLSERDRLDVPAWAGFLRRSKAQLGSEAGGDRFDLTDATRLAVNAFVNAGGASTMSEIRSRFFGDTSRDVPLRILSSRNVEAAGTKTVQILMEGHYCGYFRPDEHYIPVRRDLSDAKAALAKLADTSYCERIANNAHALAVKEFRYETLLARFRSRLEAL
jgi:hypothetical protein